METLKLKEENFSQLIETAPFNKIQNTPNHVATQSSNDSPIRNHNYKDLLELSFISNTELCNLKNADNLSNNDHYNEQISFNDDSSDNWKMDPLYFQKIR